MLKGITLVSWSRRDGQAGLLRPAAILAGVVWALTSTAFICTTLMLWVFITSREVYHLSTMLMAGIGLGALLGGAIGGKTAGYLGWLHGVVVGFIYCLAMMLLLAVWNTWLPVWFSYGIVILILAVVGGIIGVNISAARQDSRINLIQRKRYTL